MKLSNEGSEKLRKTRENTIAGRKHKELEAAPYLNKWDKESREGVCVVCGEFIEKCLDGHHPYGKAKNPHYTVMLCGSCHRIFDKTGGLCELKMRRKRYWNYNMNQRKKMIK